MATILCIETSTTVCSVALSRDGNSAELREDLTGDYSHAEQLNTFIEEVLGSSDFKDIDAVAISGGPGSYTGLRIGTSTAKGIAYAREIPIISVSTLEAMCSKVAVLDQGTLLIPMIDARRMEVYCSGLDEKGREVFPIRAEVITPQSFNQFQKFERKVFFGQGSEKCKAILEPLGFEHVPDILASAKSMAKIAEEKFKRQDFVDTAYFEPFYLKDFVAGKKKQS